MQTSSALSQHQASLRIQKSAIINNSSSNNNSNNNNNNVLSGFIGPVGMKQHVTIGPDGRPSLGVEEVMTEDEARRRREQLNRRPSYRQILKDLETVGDKSSVKRESDGSDDRLHLRQNGLGTLNNGVDGRSTSPYGSPVNGRRRNESGDAGGGLSLNTPGATMQGMMQPNMAHLIPGGVAPPGAVTIQNASPLISAAVAAAVGNSLILPTSADLMSLKPPVASSIAAADALSAAVSAAAASSAFSQNNGLDWKSNLLYNSNQVSSANSSSMSGIGPANTPGSMTSHSDTDDNNRKRQVRLQKNREAAKECRRKKKEYVKCLENRVGVLENQNKALIEELKTLKELYYRKEKSEIP